MCYLFELETWRVIRASVGGVVDVLAWVTCLHRWRACQGGVLVWVVRLRASVSGMCCMLTWMKWVAC